MWELDCEEGWALKNWCSWTVVLEKTLESPLDCKEITLVHSKRNQSWILTGRTDAEAETAILWSPDVKKWLIWKDPDAGKDWEQEEKRTVRDQTTVSGTWVMFTRKRQDMRSSCLANHVTPATPVTETKNCLYISRHTPLFAALVRFPCVGWDLGPSALEINSLLAFALLWWTCSLGRFGDTGLEHNRPRVQWVQLYPYKKEEGR